MHTTCVGLGRCLHTLFNTQSSVRLIYISKSFLAIPLAITIKIEKMLDLRIKFCSSQWIRTVCLFFFFIATNMKTLGSSSYWCCARIPLYRLLSLTCFVQQKFLLDIWSSARSARFSL